jgi:hypothetical protein
MAATCTKPDHDVPSIICGYPLPCPWHTVVIDAAAGDVTIPLASGAIGQEGRLVEIADAIGFAADVDLQPCERKNVCNCPRYLHKNDVGACSGCGDCTGFVS